MIGDVDTAPTPMIDPGTTIAIWRQGHLRAACLQAAVRAPDVDAGEVVLAAFDAAVADGPQEALAFARGLARILIGKGAADTARAGP